MKTYREAIERGDFDNLRRMGHGLVIDADSEIAKVVSTATEPTITRLTN